MPLFHSNFLSYTLKRAVEINVIIPGITSTDSESETVTHKIPEKFPVLYLLHGYCNDYSVWERYTSIERYAEERRIAVVTFSAENNYYLNMEDIMEESPIQGIIRPDYTKFFEKELSEFVTSIFPISQKAQDTYVAGLSMGGFGALHYGLRNSDKFRAIGSFSPLTTLTRKPYDSKNYDEVPNELRNYEPLYLIDQLLKESKPIPPIYYCYGGKDFLLEVQEWFKKELDQRNLNYTFDYSDEFGHEWAFWDMQVRKFLDWIPRTDYYYKDAPIRTI